MLYDIVPSQTAILRFRYDFFVACLGRLVYVTEGQITYSAAQAFALAWADQVWEAWREVLHQECRLREVEVARWDAGALSVVPLVRPGNRDGDPAPTFVTYVFRYARVVPGVRGGWKRISGVPESRAWANSTVNIPTAHKMAIEAAMVNPIVAGGLTWAPAIVVSTFGGQPLPSPKYWAPTAGELLSRLGTQNTRKG